MQTNSSFQIIRKIAAFTFPISMGALVNMVTGFIAMMMVGKISKLELAAGALAVATYMTLLTVVHTIFYAVSILISHYKGQNKSNTDIGELVKNGIYLAMFLAIPMSFILWNADHILLLFKQEQKLVALTTPYFHFAALSMFPILINSVIYQFYNGIGQPNFTLKVSIINLPIIILFSYGFVLGKFNLPQMGLGGITCAAFIVQSLLCIVLLNHLHLRKNLKKYAILNNFFKLDLTLCKSIFFLGLPIGIQFGAELAAMAVTTYMMGFFGVEALAASQIVSQYNLLIIMLALGLSQALSVLTSEAYGKHQLDLVKQYINAATKILCFFFIFIFALFLLAPHQLIKFYANVDDLHDQVLIHLATIFFALSGITMFVDSIRNILSGALRGLHDSKAPMRIGVACLWLISLPTSYLVAFTFHAGPTGLRISFISGFLVASVLLWKRIRTKLHLINQETILESSTASS